MARGRSAESVELIRASREILAEIHPAGVRAVAYRLFSRGLLPDMSKLSTDKLSRLLVAAREDGTIPWAWIVDLSRRAATVGVWANLQDYADTVVASYRRDPWAEQSVHVELLVEKDTISGALEALRRHYAIPYRVNHGHASATVVQDIAADALEAHAQGRRYIGLYLGDWDCSGLHMSEADLPHRIQERILGQLADADDVHPGEYDPRIGDSFEIQRIGLTRDDCLALGADLAFPASDKQSDARYGWFMRSSYAMAADGTPAQGPTDPAVRCWELDALDLNVLRTRVASAIERHIDPAVWAQTLAAEAADRKTLTARVKAWRR